MTNTYKGERYSYWPVYTVAPWELAAIDFSKYAKLLLIVLITFLISTREQAYTGLAFYATTQIFVLLSSWLLTFGTALPWASTAPYSETNTVFQLYIDQSITTTGFAALCWHLRGEMQAPWLRFLASLLYVMALANVLFLLPGRSGYVAAVIVIVAALFWDTKKQRRWLTLIAPILFVCLALLIAPRFSNRVQSVVSEAYAHQIGDDLASATGLRLNYWRRSVQAIAEQPLTGFGAGSWVQQYRRLNVSANDGYEASVGSPHQEFLLWGVLLGAGGIGLLLAWLAALRWDTRSFSTPHARATQSIILMLTITAIFNTVLYDGVTGDYFCLLIGLLLALGKSPAAALTTGVPMTELRAQVHAT